MRRMDPEAGRFFVLLTVVMDPFRADPDDSSLETVVYEKFLLLNQLKALYG